MTESVVWPVTCLVTNKLDDPNISDYSFELFSDKKNGKDLDVLDNVIQFPKLTD